jgi:opacity protein-like surface antigen
MRSHTTSGDAAMPLRQSARFATLAMLLLGAGAAHAQRPVTVNLGGGASFPVGAFADATKPGWHALAGLALGSLMQPMGLRLDLAHNRFEGEGAAPERQLTSGTLNLTYRLPMTNSPVSPFIIAGAGAYRAECGDDVDCGTATRFGWNAGLGMKFAGLGLKGFVESRFHATRGVRYVPVTLGLTL